MAAGRDGNIYKVKEKKTQKLFTCKIKIDNYTTRREVHILKKIKGPNLQTLHTIIKKQNKIHLITDYIPGKDLYDEFAHLQKMGINKEITHNIINEMALCVAQLHENNFVHLDIKLENFIAYKKNPHRLKLIDFENSHARMRTTRKLQMVVGTRGYAAPEIYKGFYHDNSDIWSLGVCIWCITTGFMPFFHRDLTVDTVYNKEIEHKFLFPTKYHMEYKNAFSKNQFSLLQHMFMLNPEERISIVEFNNAHWDK